MSVGHALDHLQTAPLAEMESTAHDAFVRLLEQYRAPLRRLAWSYTRNSAQRDDLFQEIALAIWRAQPGFRGECSERTFVFRIAHNRGLSFLARHADSPEVIDDVDAWQARDVNPEGRLAARQDVEHLRQAVSELPLAYRQVVMLALEDLSYAEIGEVLGISESNVGARLTRARALLKASLKGLL